MIHCRQRRTPTALNVDVSGSATNAVTPDACEDATSQGSPPGPATSAGSRAGVRALRAETSQPAPEASKVVVIVADERTFEVPVGYSERLHAFIDQHL